MGNFEAFPLVEQGRQEEAGIFSLGMMAPTMRLPDLKNYANHPDVKRWCQSELWPLMEKVRSDRMAMEEEWHEIRKMNRMVHGAGRRYFGRSDAYLPIYRRERAKLVSTLSKGLFPSDDYFDCVDMETGDPAVAKPVKQYMQWEMDQNARLRAFMKPLLSNLVDYGTAPMKFWYRRRIQSQGKMSIERLAGLSTRQYGFEKARSEGLAVSPRSLFYWYIYPYDCESLDDAQMIFEDIDITLPFVKEMKRLGRWENTDDAMSHTVPQHDSTRDRLLGSLNLYDGSEAAAEMANRITTSEVWTFMVLPKSAYLDWEESNYPIPVRIVMVNGVPVEVRRNPFFHQRPPYAVLRMDWEAGLFYGSAMGRTMAPLQYLSNDFINQTNDNGILALNPIALINLGHMVGPPRPFAPGVPWYVNNVNEAVKFERPPFEQVGMGMNMANLMIGMAQDSGGSPPDRSTQSKGVKTATGMQVLQRNSLVPLQDVVEDIEVDAMVPMLWAGWKNGVQYRSQRVMASVAGEMVQIDPEQLAIEASFSWKASSQAINNQMRSQQAISLIQAMMPLLPVIMQQGYVVDFVPLLKKVYSDGFGFRGFNEFIKRAQVMPGMGMPTPGQMPGVNGEQQDNIRSALANNYGGDSMEAQPVPGEADAFSEVRNLTDDMNALLGGGGGVLQ